MKPLLCIFCLLCHTNLSCEHRIKVKFTQSFDNFFVKKATFFQKTIEKYQKIGYNIVQYKQNRSFEGGF